MCKENTKSFLVKIIAACSILLAGLNASAQVGWKQMANFTGAARTAIGQFAIGNYGYICAGWDGGYLSDCYKWDQLTNTWTGIAAYPGGGPNSPVSFSIEGKGYVGLGNGTSGMNTDLWEYDPIANTWTARATFPGTARYDLSAFVLGHKAWMVCGSLGGPPYQQDVWEYDAHLNTWTKKNNFPGGQLSSVLTFAIGNRGYAGCGWDGTNMHQAMWQYDTSNDTWTPIAAFPGGGIGLSGLPKAFTIGTKAYVCDGLGSNWHAIPDAWVYDTITKAWCPFSHLGKVARSYGASFAINNIGYVGIGADTTGIWSGPFVNDYWEYDPASEITYSDTNLCNYPSVLFSGITGIDTTMGVTWSWTFPGGTPATSTSQYPAVTYASSGTYTVQLIVGNCGWTDTVTKTIHVISGKFPITLGGNTGICTGQNDTLSASGGTTYLWSTGATTTSIIVSPATNTTYTVHVTNGSCSEDTTITVSVGAKLPVVITGTVFICPGALVTLTASAGTSYTYKWNNGLTTSSITVTPTVNTTYSVVVSNGTCAGDTSFNVAIIPFPKLTFTTSKTSLCTGDSSVLTIGGATSYVWSTGATTTSITVFPTGDTTITVTASNGTCTKDTSVTLIMNVKPIVVVSGNMAICYGASTTLTASGGELYKWIPATGLNCDSCSSVLANPNTTTTYTVIALNGPCPDTTTAKLFVSPQPKGSVCCSDTIQMGDTAVITTTDNGATSFIWTPANSLNCATCPTVKASPQFSTTYNVIMSDSLGCQIEDSVRIYIEGCGTAWIPNAFTPNGNSLNETFGPKGICIISYTMLIFDRWGNILYNNNDSQPWSGTYKDGGSKIVPEDTYVYAITVYDGLKKTHTYRGKVTVIR